MTIVQAVHTIDLSVREIVPVGQDLTGNPASTFSVPHKTRTLGPSSTPAVTKKVAVAFTLAAGTFTLNLTSVTEGDLTTAVDLTGLRVVQFKLVAAAANTADLVCDGTGANGYDLWGAALTLNPGRVCGMYSPDQTGTTDPTPWPVVAAGVRDIVFTSTHATAQGEILITAG
jgi:hypothetical protein